VMGIIAAPAFQSSKVESVATQVASR